MTLLLSLLTSVLSCCCRAAGCLREALAVASCRLLPQDPIAQQFRKQYAAALTAVAAVNDKQAEDSANLQETTAATAAATATGNSVQSAAVAAAHLLLLDQPLAAAKALAEAAAAAADCSAAEACLFLQAAVRVAALAAPHKVKLPQTTTHAEQHVAFVYKYCS